MLPKEFESALNIEWTVQGFNANPLFIHHAGWSGFPMKEDLGFGYTSFLGLHKEGYGEMGYSIADLNYVWSEVEKQLNENPEYLHDLRNRAEREKEEAFIAATKMPLTELQVADDTVVFEYLNRGSYAMMQSVGISHVIEAVSFGIEPRFKQLLQLELDAAGRGGDFNEFFAQLTTPSKLSFVSVEEQELHAIGELTDEERRAALEQHVEKWKWVLHTYTRPRPLSVEVCEERLKEGKGEVHDLETILTKKKEVIAQVNFSEELLHLAELIDFTTVWQDDRKAFIFEGIDLFSGIMGVVSERTGIEAELLYYLSVHDIQGFESLEDVRAMHEELALRQKGCAFVLSENGIAISGDEYQEFIAAWKEKHEKDIEESQDEFRGSIANIGTAVGRVAVCMTVDEMDQVEEGDVLVTSMTRPEFMPALKKASAIVTDEGGITSHAAIVSRELGIPAIIGTKVATKVLKTGMQVEVRANHGFVRIVE